jgi:PIN domain nuclease of toxin-antitoxin system
MIAGVADTHTVIWYLLKDPRLSDKARRFIDDAAATGNEIMISPILWLRSFIWSRRTVCRQTPIAN